MSARRARVAGRGLTELSTQIAVRTYVARTRPRRSSERHPDPETVLVLDTETTTDHVQALLFGSYRVYVSGRLRQEGLIHADDLPAGDLATLRHHVAAHPADGGRPLRLRGRREFLREVFWPIAYVARGLVVGYNLPFDLSRLAFGWRPSRDGGFTLRLFDSVDAEGRVWSDLYRPEIRIKRVGAKDAFISFAAPARRDRLLRTDGKAYRGRFLDLHTLVYAFTDRSLSLDAAAVEFGLPARKAAIEAHGRVTGAYIEYNRQDVRLTWMLYGALLAEWARHPIELAPEQAYSPASLSKAYLRAAGITPPASRSDVPVERLGQATTAYYGGRTECRIRGGVPARYLDYTSMYATVFALQGLWSWVTAARLTSVDAIDEARGLLASLDRAALHDPTAWPRLAGIFCRVRPDGDLLPVRARYGAEADDRGPTGTGNDAWTIGLNRLSTDGDLWYTLADLLVAKLLGPTTPVILEAFRIVPEGVADGLRPVRLRGAIEVDPRIDDLFRVATEERARVKADASLGRAERRRLAQFLKTFANGGAYGIFAEFRQLAPVRGGKVVWAHGLWAMEARVTTPEEPGEYAFPPLAAAITGAARLLLALLETDIEARGGTYAACDTDSLLVVATEAGGLVPCPGGPERLADGREAVCALSWAEVDDVVGGLDPLRPYADGTVKALVKLEDENLAADGSGREVQLWFLGRSSKRYVLYEEGADGVRIRKASNHGLGLYRSPIPLRDDWRAEWPEWVDVVWRRMIEEAEGRDPGPEPPWFDLPAVSQLPVSSPAVIAPFRGLNAAQSYRDQVKPFGFLLAGHVDPLAPLPMGHVGPVTPVAPYSSDPSVLLSLPWRNRRDGRELRVTTRPVGEPGAVRLKTYRDVYADYRLHPEAKSGDPCGGRGRRGSTGLLPRLHVRAIGLPVHIGKESNRLEEVENGVINDADDVYVVYQDERAEWAQVLPALRRLRDQLGWRRLAQVSGLSERALRYALNDGTVPREAGRAQLMELLNR